MADQPALSAAELRDAFDAARREQAESNRATGTDEILKHVSNTVRQLQDAGADISLTARTAASTGAYDLMYTVSGDSKGSATMDVHGFLRIGQSSYLFAIATKFNDTAVKRLYISKYNTSDENSRIKIEKTDTRTQTVIFGTAYDFDSDPEALKKMQGWMAGMAGKTAALLQSDAGGVINRDAPKMTKPGLRAKP